MNLFVKQLQEELESCNDAAVPLVEDLVLLFEHTKQLPISELSDWKEKMLMLRDQQQRTMYKKSLNSIPAHVITMARLTYFNAWSNLLDSFTDDKYFSTFIASISDIENFLWKRASTWQSDVYCLQYIQRYPQGRYINQCKQLIHAKNATPQKPKLKPRKTSNIFDFSFDHELRMWIVSLVSRSPESYRKYIERYPDGRFAEKARKKLRQLHHQQQQQYIPVFTPQPQIRFSDNLSHNEKETGQHSEVPAELVFTNAEGKHVRKVTEVRFK